jgi:hypothetical protein
MISHSLFIVLFYSFAVVSRVFNLLLPFFFAVIFQSLWSMLASWGVPDVGNLETSLACNELISIVSSAQLTYIGWKTKTIRWRVVSSLSLSLCLCLLFCRC